MVFRTRRHSDIDTEITDKIYGKVVIIAKKQVENSVPTKMLLLSIQNSLLLIVMRVDK